MKSPTLEAQFAQEWQAALSAAQAACHVSQKRLIEATERRGALAAVKESLSRRRPSEGFHALEQAGRLDLSLEALAARPSYAALFTDDEVNFCMDLLCEYGFYNK